MSSPRVPIFSSAAEQAEQLARLVNALLDAHVDTERLIRRRSGALQWEAHLHYLQDLQRTRREIVAQGV